MSGWLHRISNIDVVTKTGDCSLCGRVDLFYRKSSKQWRCGNKRREDRYKIRGTPGTGFKSGICPICTSHSDELVYDHDHETKEFRGYICRKCNSGIGLLKDNPKIVQNAYIYLTSK